MADSPPIPSSATSGSNTTASSCSDQQQQQQQPQQSGGTSSPTKKQSNYTVQWAEKIADETNELAAKTVENLATGVTKVVGWTYENTKVESRGLRPMHVRVSVRVHHVSFLHPGLDTGSRTTIRDTKVGGKWRFGKKYNKKDVGPPGLLKFGKKSGSWRNPQNLDLKHQLKEVAKDVPWKSQHEETSYDPAEVAEIVNAEAFRLSRDGIIQQHYALQHAVPKSTTQKGGAQSSSRWKSPSPFSVPQGTMHPSPTSAVGTTNQTQYFAANASTSADIIQTNPYSSMLSPESLADPEGAARYYKETSARPKGYRRLVVSSLPQRHDVSIPSPPKSRSSSLGSLAARTPLEALGGEGTFSFETNGSVKNCQTNRNHMSEKDGKKSANENNTNFDHDNHNFDNVEYRYVGPPKTGPEFFELLRQHGAATFGRYLPELACSVPNHSYYFELLKSKRHAASTQPIVYECPHIIWGDARDKMLSRIADEGCPLIDARSFEYVSNSNLDDALLSESLLLCGSTIWVKKAKEGDGDDKGDQLQSKNKKFAVESEYHITKFVDDVKDGVKGVAVGTKAVIKGAKGVVDTLGKTAEATATTIFSDKVKSEENQKMKRGKLRSMFTPKKRKQKRKDDDGMSVDDSLVSGQDDSSTISEQVAPPSVQLSDHIGTVVDDGTDEEEEDEEDEEPSAEVKSSPYVLLLDDVIHLRIVSFPDKIEICKFPISVASVMVQRSMEDRLNDPFRPSELTCSFIQEPSAPELRWGVTLKVTVRAVQVRPSKVSKMSLSPRINKKLSAGKAELKRFKDKLKSMGKDDEEVKKEVERREKEIEREESELDKAIVTYGCGKNDDNQYGPKEIRLRQMFYCEREHESIVQKKSRRQPLTEDEMQLISDASMDPSRVTKKSYQKDELEKLLRLLDIHFPGIDDGYLRKMRQSIISSSSPATSGSGDVIPLSEPSANEVFSSVSLAMARSLDKCFGNAKFAESFKQQIVSASTMERKKLDAKASKLWISDLSKELFSCLSDGTTIPKVQSLLLKSVTMGADSLVEEEMKMDEDQIALSESEESGIVDVIELKDWCAAVASKLEECALELEDMYSNSEVDFSTRSSIVNDETTEDGNEEELDSKPDPSTGRNSALVPTILSFSPKTSDDDELEGIIFRSMSTGSDTSISNRNRNRSLSASSVSTIDEALPKSTQMSTSRADELLKKMKGRFMKKKSSRNGSVRWQLIRSELETERERNRARAVKVQYGLYVMLVIIAFSFGAIIFSGMKLLSKT